MAPRLQSFEILQRGLGECSSQRLGLLKLAKRRDIETPNLLALTSKGSVPHLTPDVLGAETAIQAIHAGFEDFAESIPNAPDHFSIPSSSSDSPLRRFISLPEYALLVMGPRRGKPVLSNGPNKYTSLNICTSVGHRELEITAYIEAIANSRPDVIIAPVDVEFGRQAPGVKRKDKMVERSTAWVRSFETSLKQMVSEDLATPAAWVPILPVEAEVQATYLQHLTEMASSIIGGIVVYDYASILCIPNALCDLPVISLTDPQTPHHVLRLVSLGVDLVTAPFITTASEAGIALTFEYPPKTASSNKPLGIDMSSKEYATDLGPLSEDCSCYACKQHHRAYIHHLLSVKEMLAWVLLQIHNHHIMDNFFRNIRKAIENGTFESATSKFSAAYQSILPVSQGQGPRIRGYQASLGVTPQKLNKAPFRRLAAVSSDHSSSSVSMPNEQKEKISESQEVALVAPGMDVAILDDLGFAQLYDEERLTESVDQNERVESDQACIKQ